MSLTSKIVLVVSLNTKTKARTPLWRDANDVAGDPPGKKKFFAVKPRKPSASRKPAQQNQDRPIPVLWK